MKGGGRALKQRKVLIAQTGAELTLTKKSPWIEMWKNKWFYLFILPAILVLFFFSYKPMYGIVIAFKDYNFRQGIWGSDWVGLSHFKQLFSDFFMGNAVVNTLGLSILSIGLSYPATITFTLLLNELNNVKFKRVIQTVSYLPHFISWAIMTVILNAMLSPSEGIINIVLMNLGIIDEGIAFLAREELFWITTVVASIWKNLGWNTIVYLAVIAGIDESLYEAAKIDGAGRFARMWYITLPHLVGIISIMLILSMGGIVNTGFDISFYLSNDLNYNRSNTLAYYVYTMGLRRGDFSYSTAISFLLSIVSASMMLGTNALSNKLTGKGLF